MAPYLQAFRLLLFLVLHTGPQTGACIRMTWKVCYNLIAGPGLGISIKLPGDGDVASLRTTC